MLFQAARLILIFAMSMQQQLAQRLLLELLELLERQPPAQQVPQPLVQLEPQQLEQPAQLHYPPQPAQLVLQPLELPELLLLVQLVPQPQARLAQPQLEQQGLQLLELLVLPPLEQPEQQLLVLLVLPPLVLPPLELPAQLPLEPLQLQQQPQLQ